MTLFLRNKDNQTIVDIEIYANNNDHPELKSVVVIESYSKLLLSLHRNQQYDCVDDFQEISELRGWLWERYMVQRPNSSYMDVVKKLRPYLKDIAGKYNLMYVED
jgi:hypothetical protein